MKVKKRALRYFLLAILLTLPFVSNARVYLVSVGIADYSRFPSKKISNLNLTANDAKTMVNLYSTNTNVDYSLLLNEKATKDRIVRAIKKVFNMANKDDIVMFFFSGHGYSGGLCASDGLLTYKEIRKAMAQCKCPNKIMMIDACRAGGLRVDDKKSQQATSDAKKASVMLFLSSRNNENSMERLDMKNGLFTNYLYKGLTGSADVNHDRVITAKELFDYVHENVAKASGGKQHPVMWGKFSNNMPVMKW
ncbi:MAG: caspase domain-containing protein [Lepagella sp.]